MFKTILLASLLVIAPVVTVHATATAPETTVWFTPTTANTGEAIELNAFIYNSTKKTVTATVVFTHDSSEIGKTDVTIQPATAKVATIHWQKPKNATEVVAEVTKAVASTKEAAPELLGVVGSVQISGTQNKQALPVKLTLPSEATIKGWFSSILGHIEPFRTQQAEHFTELRIQTRKELGIDEKNDLLANLDDPTAPAVPSDDRVVTEGSYSTARQLHFGLYGTYIYASAAAALFSNVAVFYITIILLILIFLRYTVGQLI